MSYKTFGLERNDRSDKNGTAWSLPEDENKVERRHLMINFDDVKTDDV